MPLFGNEALRSGADSCTSLNGLGAKFRPVAGAERVLILGGTWGDELGRYNGATLLVEGPAVETRPANETGQVLAGWRETKGKVP